MKDAEEVTFKLNYNGENEWMDELQKKPTCQAERIVSAEVLAYGFKFETFL